MKTFIKWLGAGVTLFILMFLFFTVYSKFLVDYSLDSLQMVNRLAERPSRAVASSRQVYRNLMRNIVQEEASRENLNIHNLAYLEMASRSTSEEGQGDFRSRYKFYTSQVLRSKQESRRLVLRVLDYLYHWIENIRSYSVSLWNYVTGYFNAKPVEKQRALDLTSAILLSQAEAAEKKGDWERAISLYSKYLERNPNSVDAGYITISMANIRVRQKQWDTAAEILARVRLNFAGQEEAQIAENLTREMGILKHQWNEIDRLKKEVEAEMNSVRREKLHFRLGLTYIRVGNFDEAERYFKTLEGTSDKGLQIKGRFYLGWIYKLQQKFSVSVDILKVLSEDARLDEDLRAGVTAQLADVLYQKGDIAASLQHYRNISGEACHAAAGKEVANKAWIGLSELEQSYLYFNRGDPVKSSEQMGCLRGIYPGDEAISKLSAAAKDLKATKIYESAFSSLQKGQIELARDLFQRGIQQEPGNYINYSGLAMVSILSGDLQQAEKMALKGYEIKATEYSASMVGYVLAFQNRTDEAITYYLQALEMNPDYVPARFNLPCLYLKKGDYRAALKHLLEMERRLMDSTSLLRSKVLNNLGCALWWLGKEEDAVRRFEKAVVITPGYVEAELNLKQIKLDRVPQPTMVPQIVNVEG